jgi:hypothetical protein
MSALRQPRLLELRCGQCPVCPHTVCVDRGGSNLNEGAEIMMHRQFRSGDEILHQLDKKAYLPRLDPVW